MNSFFYLLAWFIAIPTTLTFIAKVSTGIRKGIQLPDTFLFYVLAAISWAWILH